METIEDIIKEMRGDYGFCRFDERDIASLADRIEAAYKERGAEYEKELATAEKAIGNWNRNYLAEAAENVNLKHENARLRAALKPVLDIVMDSATSDLSMGLAITEAKRIFNEGKGESK